MLGGVKAFVNARSVLAPSLGDRTRLGERQDSFAERFAGTGDLAKLVRLVSPPESSWVVQIIGDCSEAIALSRFRDLQNRHKSILGICEPCR
jgi:hypothetical protein